MEVAADRTGYLPARRWLLQNLAFSPSNPKRGLFMHLLSSHLLFFTSTIPEMPQAFREHAHPSSYIVSRIAVSDDWIHGLGGRKNYMDYSLKARERRDVQDVFRCGRQAVFFVDSLFRIAHCRYASKNNATE